MGPKKKLSKKEKARLEAEQAELMRIEQEKEKQRKLEEERERKQKEREEAEKRQQHEISENKIRRQQLKASVAYFDEIKQAIDRIKDEDKKQKEWDQYMRCDGLPDVRIPGDLRKYIHVWYASTAQHEKMERNWLLKANERTLLTHDQDIPNLSRDFLRRQQGDYGDLYSRRIREVLGILVELDDCLDSGKLRPETVLDLKQLKCEIRRFLSEFIDDFSYKIMSHVERDMEITKPGVSHHTYQSDIFKSEIWAVLGEALATQKDKFREENRNTEIDFTLLNLQLSLPPTIKVSNTILRGLWLNYDHFSDYCRSYRMPKVKLFHLNILQQTKKEWKKRKEILNFTLEETTKETPSEDYDDVEKPKKPRSIDVDKIYTEYEDEMNRARRKAMGPDGLNISEFDINLRKYRIISGVYAIDLLEYPLQDGRIDDSSFIRTVVAPSRLIKRPFYHPYRPPPPPPPGVRRLPEEIEIEMKLMESNLEKLSQITLQLPDTVLWFEPPIVCRWETSEETEESENNKKVEEMNISLAKISSEQMEDLPVKEVVDFDLCNIPNHVDLFGLMTDFVVPRLPDSYCIRLERKKPEKKKTVFHYLSRNFNVENGLPKSGKKLRPQGTPIVETLIQTGSPRPFDPEIVFTKILRIKQAPSVRRRSSCFDPIEVKDGVLGMTKSYMFSELIEDLDEIYEMHTTFLDRKLNEIKSSLSSTSSLPADNGTRRFSGVIIIRESEIPEILEEDEKVEEEDSCSEYDDPDKGDEDDNGKGAEDKFSFGRWSTRDVHDTKFNEDKFSIQFRTGRLGFFGFAANRYSNMPYQTWEVKPDLKNTGAILYGLTAAVITMEMTVTKEGYCITNFQGGSTESLNQIIGRTMSLDEMKNILQGSAVDIFPEEDAFCYTEGSCEKNYVMEMHLYNCMSTLALSHNFSWSRWNLLSGSRTAVLLIREFIEGKKIPDHSTLLVTPLKTSIVDCTEVSTSFSTVGVPGMEFYADLHQLALVHTHSTNQEKRRTMDPVLRDNVAQILMSTRPLSFC